MERLFVFAANVFAARRAQVKAAIRDGKLEIIAAPVFREAGWYGNPLFRGLLRSGRLLNFGNDDRPCR